MDRSTDRRDVAQTGQPANVGFTGEGQLAHLDELDGYKVADGEPDIRGWAVRTSDGRKIGKVEDLVVDTAAMRVRYMEVELDKRELKLDDDRHVLVPIGTARLNDDDDVVVVSSAAAELTALPPYARGAFTRDNERGLLDRFDRGATGPGSTGQATGAGAAGGAGFYDNERFDDRQFFGSRRRGRDDDAYVVRSEEELTIGKRRVEGGSVGVRKTVETEHVRESVPVMREEVEIERRPIQDAAAQGELSVGEDEIRVPLMAEEVVTEKRVVPKEEVVIRKRAVQEEEVVEADLRRERLDVDDTGMRDPRTPKRKGPRPDDRP